MHALLFISLPCISLLRFYGIIVEMLIIQPTQLDHGISMHRVNQPD